MVCGLRSVRKQSAQGSIEASEQSL